ncbi:O-antigen ligase family protein [Herbiconiux sp. CPCC 203407]|uniref:O-antigen ligase family protein n=1 Tax=Herbiconiux oxytropis TaxID=2970915 RepID=A0AA42BW81_9MICO|nr:O-antigen ligase family protein [Herbiconiux oxytropis]MCS5722050.1 O-antigen ligase family protein [Herbiconiux oxytropis]MCS5725633.1 O-antigen ligase family protein [Herbiconiux oxytropis]
MTRVPQHPVAVGVLEFFGSTRFARVLTLAILGTAFLSFPLRSMIGWPGLIAIVSALVVFAGLSFVGRWHDLDWHGLLPISLLVFVGWCAVTLLWSSYLPSTLNGLLYQLAYAFLGVYIAVVRDLIQVVRALGDVLRVVLTASLAVEILAGLLLDTTVPFLNVTGGIASGGPVQGILGTRNMLGFVAMLALVTFAIELATRSIRRGIGIYSAAIAVIAVVLSGSPVTLGVAVVTGVATVILLALRRAASETRRGWHFVLLAVSLLGLIVGYLARGSILALLSERREFTYRLEIWRELWRLIDLNALEGWGWTGFWRSNVSPFFALDVIGNRSHTSALNAFVDVYFQTGLVGFVIFVGFVALAFGRAWVLAAARKSIVFLWTALVIVVLVSTSMAESAVLVEYGWLLLVICSVKAARDLSWRGRLRRADEPVAPVPVNS